MSLRRDFLVALQMEIRSNFQGTADQHEIGASVGLGLDAADALVKDLQRNGLIQVVGLGGDILLTEKGIDAINDPSFE